jgi:murein DD-endopeptidase MepM/ murein hydrolase activator NlpD
MMFADVEPAAGYDPLAATGNHMPAGLSLASMMIEDMPEPIALDREVVIESGDALSSVMEKEGVGNTETQKIITAMKPHLDPRYIKAGQKIAIHFDESAEAESGASFREMKIQLDKLKTLVVARAGEEFESRIDEKKVEKTLKAKQAEIEVSLSGSAAKAGIPSAVVAEAIRIFSWNVDFQRDIRPKDSLEVLYESYETEEGLIAKSGNILYAKLTLSGREIPLYRFEMEDGRTDYFQPDGRSIKRTLMKTPINGARMSSGFGKRRHPVLGYTKMHKGVDFAARTGTPIFAAGDGVIERAGWFSSFGKYVRIRHNSKLKTAYAHMSKIKVKNGQRVTQGDVIGYVGTTGRSTGPHLHYEVISNGRQVNPNSVDLPTGEELKGKDLTNFKSAMTEIRRQYASALEGTKIASFARRLFTN